MLNIVITLFTLSSLAFSQFSLTYKGQLDESFKKRYRALGIEPKLQEKYSKSKLPTPDKINQLLTQAGLANEKLLTEQIDKDIFFLKACKYSLKQFQADQTKLPISKVNSFYELSHQHGC
jgi:hypothetical protein